MKRTLTKMIAVLAFCISGKSFAQSAATLNACSVLFSDQIRFTSEGMMLGNQVFIYRSINSVENLDYDRHVTEFMMVMKNARANCSSMAGDAVAVCVKKDASQKVVRISSIVRDSFGLQPIVYSADCSF